MKKCFIIKNEINVVIGVNVGESIYDKILANSRNISSVRVFKVIINDATNNIISKSSRTILQFKAINFVLPSFDKRRGVEKIIIFIS